MPTSLPLPHLNIRLIWWLFLLLLPLNHAHAVTACGEHGAWLSSQPEAQLSGVAYGKSRYVAVGENGVILASHDGVHWLSRSKTRASSLRGVAWGGGQFVAVGWDPESPGRPGTATVLTSHNGVDWLTRNAETSAKLEGIVYGNGQFVAVGYDPITLSGVVLTSPNGLAWSVLNLGIDVSLEGVAYGEGDFVAVGHDVSTGMGVIVRSADGAIWTEQVAGTNGWLKSVVWNGLQFTAVGWDVASERGIILTSYDGFTWTLRNSDTKAELHGVAWNGVQFLAVGFSADTPDAGIRLTSADGINWTQDDLGMAISPRGVTQGGDRFVVVGRSNSHDTNTLNPVVSIASRTDGARVSQVGHLWRSDAVHCRDPLDDIVSKTRQTVPQLDLPRSLDQTTTQFFHHEIPASGTTLTNVAIIPGKLTAQSIAVVAHSNGVITATAVLEAGHGGTINAHLTWQDDCNWLLQIHANGAPGQEPTNHTAINLNHVTGVIQKTHCTLEVKLKLHGYSIGNSSFDVQLHVVSGHFEGSAVVNDLVLGGVTYPRVKVSLSTLSVAARLEGTMQVNLGTFTVDVHITAPDGVYSSALTVTGADLKLESNSFYFTDFYFSATSNHIPAGGETTFTAAVGGTLVMKKTTYTLQEASIKIVGSSITEFKINIYIKHQNSHTETYEGWLLIALDSDGGTFQELTKGRNDNGWHLAETSKPYATAFLGSITLQKTRGFSRKFSGRTFSREVTIGLTFGVSIYQPSAHANYETYIGAGGYFDADRVSGEFGCTYASEATDFSCLGTIRVNPSWAGVYRHTWEI
ncbi:hypothetical protein CCP3SC1_360038 [Gammaproteobacteria bacterium]